MLMEALFFILPAIVLVYLLVKYGKVVKKSYAKLTISQFIGVIFAYLMTALIVFLLIYYVGNWLLSYITFRPLNIIIKVVLVIAVFFSALNLLNKTVKKITNGVL